MPVRIGMWKQLLVERFNNGLVNIKNVRLLSLTYVEGMFVDLSINLIQMNYV